MILGAVLKSVNQDKLTGSISTRKLIGKPGDPESLSSSLAHIVVSREGEDVILGQAWLAASNTLITCGHVIQEYKRNPAEITVVFPLSGNRYVVREIILHPTYGKKGNEQLIRFDIAMLTVDLMGIDAEAPLLPITYDKFDRLHNQQTLSAIRYPSHLGQLTTSQFPLAQVGRYLGPLKKGDRFHLLHDLALAPGDSGSPIFDGDSVVAIHCGDTATLPGLNLPTTSIRLAVSVDALQALDIAETKKVAEPNVIFSLGPAMLAFMVTTILAFGIASYVLLGPISTKWALSAPDLKSAVVTFNKPVDGFRKGDAVSITVTPEQDCYLSVFYTEDEHALVLFPPPSTGVTSFVKGGNHTVINGYGDFKMRADERQVGKIHMVLLKNGSELVSKKELEEVDSDNCELPINAGELKNRIEIAVSKMPGSAIHEAFNAPRAQATHGSVKEESKEAQPENKEIEQKPSEQSFDDSLEDVSTRHEEVLKKITEKEEDAIRNANQQKEAAEDGDQSVQNVADEQNSSKESKEDTSDLPSQ